MKKIYVFSMVCQLVCATLFAQTESAVRPKGKSHIGSLDIQIPVGVFARSHVAGAGLNYSWSHHRYGKDISPSKPIGFTFTAGADYYFGKRIKPAGYNFNYTGYLYGYLLAGIITNPWTSTNISLTAGPTMGFYKGNSDMGIGVNLVGNYYINKNISIGPGVTYKKHSDADALWTGVVRISYAFR